MSSIPHKSRPPVWDLKPTHELYYEQPYLREFEGVVLRKLQVGDYPGVVLDKTAFYPDGGGQPGDKGLLISDRGQTIPILDTIQMNGVVVHITEERNENSFLSDINKVMGKIDWERRYALMQNYTASHIVFSAIRHALDKADLMYKGSQLGIDRSRIDVNSETAIDYETLVSAQHKANQVCQDRRPVRSWYEEREEAGKKFGQSLGLTEVTPIGKIRLVEIENWDIGACCGIHVASSIEASPIKILSRERISGGTERIEFMAGKAAYDYFRSIDVAYRNVAKSVNVPTKEVPSKVVSLLKENEDLRADVDSLREVLARKVARELLLEAGVYNGTMLIVKELEETGPEVLRLVVSDIVGMNVNSIVVLGSFKDDKGILTARCGNSAGLRMNLGDIVRAAVEPAGGRGGGSSNTAQAQIPNKDSLKIILANCRNDLLRIVG